MSSDTWAPLSAGEVQRLLATTRAAWWVAGGVAIDVFVGRATRAHSDIDVQILRGDELEIARQLEGWELLAAREGRLTPWSAGVEANQIWCRPSSAAPWTLELVIADVVDGNWVYRRDRRISCPLAELGLRTEDGIPIVRPEIQLLFKSKRCRAKDVADFESVRPVLSEDSRARLRDALALVDPGHSWIAALS